MATYNVTKVDMQWSTNAGSKNHEHIVGVKTGAGVYYSNQEVVDSIKAGNTWQTSVEGEPKATIKEYQHTYCPEPKCLHKPYLTTAPDHSKKNNLDNLPRV